MIWLPLLAIPMAAALVKLGSVITMIAVLSLALRIALVVVAVLVLVLLRRFYAESRRT